MGIFTSMLAETLRESDAPIRMVGIKASSPEQAVEAIRRLVRPQTFPA